MGRNSTRIESHGGTSIIETYVTMQSFCSTSFYFLAEQAEGILDGVRKLLKDSPFKGL